MSERVSAEEFSEALGVEDWHVEGDTAYAVFRTGSFGAGIAFVNRIGELAEEQNHHPDVDLRYPSVLVRLTTHDAGGLTGKDIDLARAVSGAAADLGVGAE